MVTKDGLSSEQHSFDNGRATTNAGVFALGILGAMKGGKGGTIAKGGNKAAVSLPKQPYVPFDKKTGTPSPLPRNKHGVDIPSSDVPHTQLGWRKSDKGDYAQTREWGYDGKPVKTTDWTNHGTPDLHECPHDHPFKKNSTGGTPERGKGVPFTITSDKTVWEN